MWKRMKKPGLKRNIQKTKIIASSPITSWQMDGETVTDFIFLDSKINVDGYWSHEIKRCLLFGRKAMTNLDQHMKKQRHYFANKGPSSQSYAFSSSHVSVWELGHKEGWVPKNQCFQTVLLKKTLEIPLDSKEINPANPKGNQSWIFIERTVNEAEVPILWPPDVKSWLIGKCPDAWERLKAKGEGSGRGWNG